MAATVVVLAFFAVDTLRNAPETFAAIVAIAALAVVLDAVWKHVRKEEPPTESRLAANEVSAELQSQELEEES
jgi:chromate transport protein ChrA